MPGLGPMAHVYGLERGPYSLAVTSPNPTPAGTRWTRTRPLRQPVVRILRHVAVPLPKRASTPVPGSDSPQVPLAAPLNQQVGFQLCPSISNSVRTMTARA